MAQQLTREAARARLEAAREALDAYLARHAEAELAALQATEQWSALDVLRHMLVWDELGARCLEHWQDDRAWMPHYDDEDHFNIEMVAAQAGVTLEAIGGRIRLAYRRFAEALELSSPDELREVGTAPWGERVTRPHMINELLGHDLEHLQRLS